MIQIAGTLHVCCDCGNVTDVRASTLKANQKPQDTDEETEVVEFEHTNTCHCGNVYKFKLVLWAVLGRETFRDTAKVACVVAEGPDFTVNITEEAHK